jgi:hypothetical protein
MLVCSLPCGPPSTAQAPSSTRHPVSTLDVNRYLISFIEPPLEQAWTTRRQARYQRDAREPRRRCEDCLQQSDAVNRRTTPAASGRARTAGVPGPCGGEFRCRVDLRGDVVEFTRDPSEIEMVEGIDTELPQPDICDALPIAGKHTLTF